MSGVLPHYYTSHYLDLIGLHPQRKQHKGEILKRFTNAAAKDQCDQHNAAVSHAAAAAALLHHISHA